MATTTNFGWETPDDTDLVKDGALAMRTLGNAIDTSLVDLKGGTTGQVLSKTSNTDMDFTWVTSDDANAIQNTIVDAKGDLITATGSDVPARLAVGNNGDTLLADSSTSTGLRWQATQSTQNYIVNGGQDIWQRGTSFASGASAIYTADRWQLLRAAGASGATVSRQTGTTGFEYAARVQRDSGNSGTGIVYYGTSLESSQSIPLAGLPVVISFYARAGANYSSASSGLTISLATGTGTNQNIFSGFTGQVTAGTTVTLTTSWQRFSYTTTLASNQTQIAAYFGYTPVGTASTNDWFEVTGVQLQVGAVPTTFRRSGGTLQGELAACQRYYYRTIVTATGQRLGWGHNNTTSISELNVLFPVTMRIGPTALETTGTASDYSIRSTNNNFTCDAVPTFSNATTYMGCFNMTTASTMTAGNGSHARANASTTYLGWSAEL
jgi:hypothetical protein